MFIRTLTAITPKSSARRSFHNTKVLNEFFEPDRKGGYKDNRPRPSTLNLIKDGFKQMKGEIALWTQEVKEHFDVDPLLIYRPGETDVAWRFNNEETINRFIVTSDTDNQDGFSNCSFKLNKFGHGVFSGVINTRVPQDGKRKRAGYCNIRSLPNYKSFKRETFYNWAPYNTLVLKVRGDGRSYMINVARKGYFDLFWNDVYHSPLYTRGGPYWQITKIPFSKLFFASKGRVQDVQACLPAHKVSSFGITIADKVNGPFQLEIDYIGLEFDPNYEEEFAYELYQTERFISRT